MASEGEIDRRLWGLLLIAGICLVFQLFPSIWLGLVAALDARTWTWRAFAVVCAVSIVVLVAARAWQNSRQER